MSKTERNEIVCKASSWIKIRAALILLMLGVFSYLFYQDGTTGYKEKNLHFFMHNLFTDVAPKLAKDGGYTEETWKSFAEGQEVPFPAEEEGPVLASANGMKWPDELVNGFDELKEGSSGSGPNQLWRAYTGRRQWDEEVSEKPYDLDKVNEQFYFSYGSLALFVVILFFFIRTLSRNMRVTDGAFYAPGGEEVPFSSMKRIDKRKWDTKGVATIFYDKGNGEKKVKVDGMIYGSFKKEDGEPAEKLFQMILQNFKGEIVEYEVEEAEDETVESDEAKASM